MDFSEKYKLNKIIKWNRLIGYIHGRNGEEECYSVLFIVSFWMFFLYIGKKLNDFFIHTYCRLKKFKKKSPKSFSKNDPKIKQIQMIIVMTFNAFLLDFLIKHLHERDLRGLLKWICSSPWKDHYIHINNIFLDE